VDLVHISRDLAASVDNLRFGAPVTHVYNPLRYAQSLHEEYLRRFGNGHKATLFLGMNPGPWGMAQTGVPFGEVATVRDWLGLSADVDRPKHEHPKRPVLGLQCTRSEVSGRRLWGWARERWGDPESFFEDFFVANYCPLVFIEESGRNRTPDKLPAAEREPLIAHCDLALRRTIEFLGVDRVIGIGRFARLRAAAALADTRLPVFEILHPSPASPAANRGWAERATEQLRAVGLSIP
jgi:single-strand selective monofunctional uracil DNA glycosylase